MSIFTYTALRELSPGTTLSQIVTRDIRLLTKRLQRKPKRKQNTGLSGSIESLLLRSEKHYSCQTGVIVPRSLDEARILEFLASVENGETFTFDRYGSTAQPDNPITCYMVSAAFNEDEVAKAFHRYGFVIREA